MKTDWYDLGTTIFQIIIVFVLLWLVVVAINAPMEDKVLIESKCNYTDYSARCEVNIK